MSAGITSYAHDRLMSLRAAILAGLTAQMAHRADDDTWELNERCAVVAAANEWLRANVKPVTLADVEAIEHAAVGHVDYASKLSLYVAELALGHRGVR